MPRAKNNIIVNKSNSTWNAFQMRLSTFLFTVGSSSETEEGNGKTERREGGREEKERQKRNER